MYNEKFGAARIAQMLPMMAARFGEVGLTYSIGGNTGNTLDSHRLAAHALKVGGETMQNRLMEELFLNYFCEEKYLGDRAVLVAAALKAQVPEAEQVLDDKSAMLEETKQDLAKYGRGISGVPHFIIDGKYGIGGAQPTEAFVEIFEELANE
mmetsp:Transcript_14477/g.34222  ORF Transcript_14477/g.34222 Transcript_14477/m.34222 type:complete len:152 (+) Transcript_14477:256-711(+)|eukprot:CAMPEP_0172615750 /NCGR_PEP_ID=MMETSP1068-20121228/62481_1 /TAXON_ID=35684 /ORGANISM="Pseudopedinella elastica, Strain CCMP716" /LENGTH=151 /DNA_ID=CAMNT_0013420995 /DNA_START=251 /DNA_END=706 /DNA_ORIENTATION=-